MFLRCTAWVGTQNIIVKKEKCMEPQNVELERRVIRNALKDQSQIVIHFLNKSLAQNLTLTLRTVHHDFIPVWRTGNHLVRYKLRPKIFQKVYKNVPESDQHVSHFGAHNVWVSFNVSLDLPSWNIFHVNVL